MDRFYTSRAFQRYQEHPNRSSYDKVMALRSWIKNRIQVQRSSLEEAMDELRRAQAESTMAQSEFSRSMTEMDHSQVGLPQFFYPNEISHPPHERMTKLEAALVEMKSSSC